MQWNEIEAWATDKLAQARKQNDGGLTEIETAQLRGRIAMLKELIALPDHKKIMDAQSRSVTP